MASRYFSEEDFSCPVCCEIFKDPILLLCSHSICKMCLKLFWETRGSRECPICRKKSPQKSPPLNLHLRNLCEIFLRSQRKTFSSLPNSELKPFCEVDKKTDSLVCRNSEIHETHIGKAGLVLKEELKVRLRPLQETIDSFKLKTNCMETAQHRHVQEQERIIKEEFEKLHQFLRDEEAARIAALRREEELKSQMMKDKIDGGISEGSWSCGIFPLRNSAVDAQCQTTKPKTDSLSSSSSPFKLDSNTSTDSEAITSLASSCSGSKFGGSLSESSSGLKFGAASSDSDCLFSGSFNFGSLTIRDQFKKPKGSWKCVVCCAQNKAKGLQCVACRRKRSGSKTEPKGFKFGSSSTTLSSSGFVFGGPPSDPSSVPSSGFKFGESSSDSNTQSAGLMFGGPATESSSTTCGGFKFGGSSLHSSRGFQYGSDLSESFNSGTLVIQDKFKQPVGSRECHPCLEQNKVEDLQCVAFQSDRPRAKPESKGTFDSPMLSGGFSSRNTFTNTTSSGFQIGGTSLDSSSTPSNGFKFGGPPSNSSTPSSGFKLGGPPSNLSTLSSGFKFGGPPSTSSTPFSGFKFSGPPSNLSTPSSRFKFGGPPSNSSTPSSGFKLGVPPSNSSTPSSGFKFGGPPSASSTPSSGFKFSGPPSDLSTPSSGFKFGGPPSNSSTHSSGFKFSGPPSNLSTPSSGFKFGGCTSDSSSVSSNGFKFGETSSESSSTSSSGFKFGWPTSD